VATELKKSHLQLQPLIRCTVSVLEDQSVRGTDCDTDRYLVVAEVRERLAVSKRAAHKIDTERFNVKKLNGGDVTEQYQVTIRNKFADLGNLEDSGDINGTWDNIRENIKISARIVQMFVNRSVVKHGSVKKCSKLVDRLKQD
jgi:hypothetical protein